MVAKDALEMQAESSEVLRRKLAIQMKNKVEIRTGKLKMFATLITVVFLFFTVLQGIAVAFFTKGFLLSRPVLDNYSTLDDDIFSGGYNELKAFDKAVIIIIDALRFDFVIPQEGVSNYYTNHLALPYQLCKNEPQNSVLLKFMADPPTTTLQRLKGLTTGSLPTFIDAGSNFDGDVITEDNLIKQLHSHGKNITFVGDDTWKALFSPYLNHSLPYDSLNVWDLHTVDNGVIEHVLPFLRQPQEWDVLIGHLLGVDHCGHRYGPDHYAMEEKQLQMDVFLKDVVDALPDDTLLVVMGDHGMDRTGNHGGDSKDELEAALWLYSKQASFKPLPADNYNTSMGGESYRSVNQIDLLSTLSLLLGVPIPYNNLGMPIQEAFKTDSLYELATLLTIKQIQRYRLMTSSLRDMLDINLKFNETVGKWAQPDYLQSAIQYQLESLENCKDLWTRFDMASITIGISLLIVSFFIIIAYTKLIPSVVISQLSEEIVPAIIAMVSLITVIFIAIGLILKPTFLDLVWISMLGVSIGIIIGFLIPIFDRYSIKWLTISLVDIFKNNYWDNFGLLLMILHGMIFASNSFTIWEDRITNFFLISIGFLFLVNCFSADEKFEKFVGVYHSLNFIVLTRLSSLITICREEQGDKCTPSFTFNYWCLIFMFVNAVYLPLVIKQFFKIKNSYQSAAPTWNKVFGALLFLVAVYWSVEYIENNQTNSRLLGSIDLSILHFSKFTIARIVTGVGLVVGMFAWSLGPLCIKLNLQAAPKVEPADDEETHNSKKNIILGYENIYGSQYFLLVMNVLALLFLFTKPMGQVALFLLVNQLLSALELIKLFKLRTSLISPIILGFLGISYFFSTGHQATIPSINWELGFTLTETIMFPFTHLVITMNTFSSLILVSISVPLLTLWGVQPSMKPISLYSTVVENCGMLIIYQTFITICCLIFATVFKRHLMVWKIFAPRFMFSVIYLILMDLVITLVSIGFGSRRLLVQINRIFGK